MTPAESTVEAGKSVQLTVKLNGSVTPESPDGAIIVAPDAATYTVKASRTSDDATTPVELNSRTRVDNYGVLHVQKSGFGEGRHADRHCDLHLPEPVRRDHSVYRGRVRHRRVVVLWYTELIPTVWPVGC